MNIAMGSAFRNSSGGQLQRYLHQVTLLRNTLPKEHSLRVIAAEGDSSDGTRRELLTCFAERGIPLMHVDTTHGQRWFGSTEDPQRMQVMSRIGNAIFDAVQPEDDILVYVESDSVWDAFTMITLMELAWQKSDGFDVVAPLVFAGTAFYDIWGFRKNGERFVGTPPYHIALDMRGLTEVDSVGSCLVMRGDVARACRIRNDYCLVGWCEDARAHGFRIAAASHLRVHHV